MTTGIELKARWRRGEVILGSFVHCTDPSFVNIYAHLGFDYLMIDTEHQPFNPETLQTLLLTIRASTSVPLVRVAGNDTALIKHALDFGAEGVMVPLVNNAEEARAAVAACKYPPMGKRGMGGRAVTDFYRSREEYVSTANERTIVFLQIEDIEAVNRVDEIARVPGVDCLVTGQVDLAASMDLGWQPAHPAVTEATQRVIDAARAAGVAAGLGLSGGDLEQTLKWVERGVGIVSLDMDWMYMSRAAKETLAAVRGGLARQATT
jgi:2-keto-3-deoxy-L-rhamnonate aldolase RhmA